MQSPKFSVLLVLERVGVLAQRVHDLEARGVAVARGLELVAATLQPCRSDRAGGVGSGPASASGSAGTSSSVVDAGAVRPDGSLSSSPLFVVLCFGAFGSSDGQPFSPASQTMSGVDVDAGALHAIAIPLLTSTTPQSPRPHTCGGCRYDAANELPDILRQSSLRYGARRCWSLDPPRPRIMVAVSALLGSRACSSCLSGAAFAEALADLDAPHGVWRSGRLRRRAPDRLLERAARPPRGSSGSPAPACEGAKQHACFAPDAILTKSSNYGRPYPNPDAAPPPASTREANGCVVVRR